MRFLNAFWEISQRTLYQKIPDSGYLEDERSNRMFHAYIVNQLLLHLSLGAYWYSFIEDLSANCNIL